MLVGWLAPQRLALWLRLRLPVTASPPPCPNPSQVEQLEREIAALQARLQAGGRSRFAMPSASDVLGSLGIGSGGSQQQGQPDAPAGAAASGADLAADVESLRRLPLSNSAGGRKAGATRRAAAASGGGGHVSIRTGLLVADLVALHLSLMVSMNATTHCHHAAITHTLPGH